MSDAGTLELVNRVYRPALQRLRALNPEVDAVDADLVLATICTESGGASWKTRYEPGWTYLYFDREHAERLGITAATETVMQKMSWGLMQIMGSVARELGFNGDLPSLCEVDTNLAHGCRKLKQLMQRYAEETDWISAYNAGSPRKTDGQMYVNQRYVDRVSWFLRELRKPAGQPKV